MSDLFVEDIGSGDAVVLVHGSGPPGATWSKQRVLAERFRLLIPDRRGYGRSPRADPTFEADAHDIAALLGDGAHLVGFSYGGVGSLLAAARRPDAVRSLTVIEPPAFGVAPDDPVVARLVERLGAVYRDAPDLTPDEFDARFDSALAGKTIEPQTLAPEMRVIVEAIMRERPPWEAQIPLEELAAAPFPTLVVSAAWSKAFETVCGVIASALGAEREIFAEHRSHGVQAAAGFNDRVEAFWRNAV